MLTGGSPSPNMTYYDPLASHFMTSGQMQYMPDSQYLTSSNYGSFRTTPGYGAAPTSMHEPTFLQSWLTAQRGSPFGMLPSYMVNTYNPAVDQSQHLIGAQRRSSDQISAASSAFAGGAATTVAALAATVAGGPLVGLAVGLGMPGLEKGYMDRIRMARQVQNLSMSTIAAGPDMAKGLGKGFSMEAATDISEGIRGQAASNLMFNRNDLEKMMRMGMESGQFDYSMNASQYKDTMAKLTKNFKTFMEVLETADMAGIGQQMQRMQRMGANMNQMGNIVNKESMFARMTGLSHMDLVNTYGQQGALIYSQAGLTNYQGSMAAMSNAANVTMMQRMGLITPGAVARGGGISGITQDLTATGAHLFNKNSDNFLAYIATDDFTGIDQEKLAAISRGDISQTEALRAGANRIANPTARGLYQQNRAHIQEQAGEHLGSTGMHQMNIAAAMELGKKLGATDNIDAVRLGLMRQGVADDKVDLIVKGLDEKVLNAQLDQLKIQRQRVDINDQEERDYHRSLKGRIVLGAKETMHDFGRATYGRFSSWRAEKKDREENEKIGVVDLGTRHLSGIDKKRFEDATGPIESAEGRSRSEIFSLEDRYAAARKTGGAFSGQSAPELLSTLEMQEEILSAHSAEEDLASPEALGKYALNAEQLTRSAFKHLRGNDNPTEKDILHTIAQALESEGMAPDKAKAQAVKVLADPAARAGAFQAMTKGPAMKNFVQALSDRQNSYVMQLAKQREQVVVAAKSDIDDSIRAIGKQGKFGDMAKIEEAYKSGYDESVEGTSAYGIIQKAKHLMLSSRNKKEAGQIEAKALELLKEFGIEAGSIAEAEEQFNDSEMRKKMSDGTLAKLAEVHALDWSEQKDGSWLGRRRSKEEQLGDLGETLLDSRDKIHTAAKISGQAIEDLGVSGGVSYRKHAAASPAGGRSAASSALTREEGLLEELIRTLHGVSRALTESSRRNGVPAPGEY